MAAAPRRQLHIAHPSSTPWEFVETLAALYLRFQVPGSRFQVPGSPEPGTGTPEPLHLPVPVFRLGVDGTDDFQMPLAAAPGLNHLGGDDVDENFGESPPLGIPSR